MPRLILLCGRTCSGKTLGGQILARTFGYQHIEASSLMREFWMRTDQRQPLETFAKDSLLADPTRIPTAAVARAKKGTLVLTGLRSPAEVAAARKAFAESRLIFLHTPIALRLQRSVRRGRPGHPNSIDHLERVDGLHNEMGLNSVQSDSSAIQLENKGSLESYARKLATLLTK